MRTGTARGGRSLPVALANSDQHVTTVFVLQVDRLSIEILAGGVGRDCSS
jgi:hypothetical protein